MPKVAGAIFAAFVCWLEFYRLRDVVLPRRRLERFLASRGVDFVRMKRPAGAYGWPAYEIVFESLEKSTAFRASEAFEALVKEVAAIHGRLEGFDARWAVSVAPRTVPEAV
jgi:hypothetical protein